MRWTLSVSMGRAFGPALNKECFLFIYFFLKMPFRWVNLEVGDEDFGVLPNWSTAENHRDRS